MNEGPLRELASGVDALYLSGHCEPTLAFLARLEATRELAELLNEPMELYVGGLGFKLAPHGWGRYRYLLVHELGRVGVSTSQHLPPVRVQPRSELLHAVGPVATVQGFTAVLAEDCPDMVFTVTRVDLFSDWQGLQLDSDCRSQFSCRAATSRSFEVGGVVSGLDFGRRSTKTFSARIYDKTAEIARSGADWWKGVWGDSYRQGEQVWRVEFEIGRDGLAGFGLATPAQVLAATSDLWRYATEEWLTYRVACSDQTRSRWDVAPEWRQIRRASLRAEPLGLNRIAAGKKAGSLRRIMPPLAGYLAAFAALIGTYDIEGTLQALDRHLRDDEIARSTPFRERICRRRAEVGSR
jgi:hypothetical protein